MRARQQDLGPRPAPGAGSGAETRADPRALRRCFGRFATGVAVVSYRVGDEIRGATVNSFTSVSIDPPLLLIALGRTTQACAALEITPFAVNVLRSDQVDVALQFAGRSRPGVAVTWEHPTGDGDLPVMTDAVAVFRCWPWARYEAGDHVLHLGGIAGFEHRAGDPLMFGDGRFQALGLPILDGPLVYSLDGPPSPGWVGAATRFHALPEH